MDWKKWYADQIEWFKKQNEFCRHEIEYCNKEIKRCRAWDREVAEFALKRNPGDELTIRLFGGKYVGNDTRKAINERAKCYREIKRNNGWIEKYTKSLNELKGKEAV